MLTAATATVKVNVKVKNGRYVIALQSFREENGGKHQENRKWTAFRDAFRAQDG